MEDQQQVESHNAQGIRIFTDGSKIDGKVGVALSLWSNDVETKNLKLKLSSYCTVFQAELLAIYKATGEIIKGKDTSYGIYSDSRSALETVANIRSLNPLATKIRGNLIDIKKQQKKVELFWIKAHAGLVGNERADVLAKDAALKNKTKPNYDRCPVSFVKRQIRLETLDEWNRRYRGGETAAVTKLFLPDAVQAFKIIRDIRPTGVLTQVMTGHGGFSEYLHRFKCKGSPACLCGPEIEETVMHILTECPIYGRKRLDIEYEIGIEIKSENIRDIIADKHLRKKFLEYCIKV